MTPTRSSHPSVMGDASDLAVVSLGSNLGDSQAVLRSAFDRLQAWSETPVIRSSLWQTSPVDCPPGSPPFVNAVALLRPAASVSAEQLLSALQELEREFGRRLKKQLNEPRPLDLDIIWFRRESRRETHLTLPHPRAHQRRFVLQPLAELLPQAIFPGQGKSVSDLLAGLHTHEQVVLLED